VTSQMMTVIPSELEMDADHSVMVAAWWIRRTERISLFIGNAL
jgi:hypothetical protein